MKGFVYIVVFLCFFSICSLWVKCEGIEGAEQQQDNIGISTIHQGHLDGIAFIIFSQYCVGSTAAEPASALILWRTSSLFSLCRGDSWNRISHCPKHTFLIEMTAIRNVFQLTYWQRPFCNKRFRKYQYKLAIMTCVRLTLFLAKDMKSF